MGEALLDESVLVDAVVVLEALEEELLVELVSGLGSNSSHAWLRSLMPASESRSEPELLERSHPVPNARKRKKHRTTERRRSGEVININLCVTGVVPVDK